MLVADGTLLTGIKDESGLSEDQITDGGAWSVSYPMKGQTRPRVLCFRIGRTSKPLCQAFKLVSIVDYNTRAATPPRRKVIRFADGTEFKEVLRPD